MDNNITWLQEQHLDMQNWKKQIIMDPVLNGLFDANKSAQDLLITKILPMNHQDIVNIYSKLTTIKHQLSLNLQKQVEHKHSLIENSFLQFMRCKSNYDQMENPFRFNEHLSYLKNFNHKYETVESGLILWKNITSILHYSEALEKFRVNSNILKTLMRGYNGNEQTINSIKVAKMLKQLTEISIKYNFNGITAFEAEKVFISSTKNIIHGIACKKLSKSLIQAVADQQEGEQKTTKWIEALVNIGTLRQFIGNHFKSMLMELGEKVKKTLQMGQHEDKNTMKTLLQMSLLPYVSQSCKSLIYFEEKLVKFRADPAFANVPNLFIKFWDKFCEYVSQTIAWVKKDQESRNPPKSRDFWIIWKYPIIFRNFNNFTSLIHQYVLENAKFNFYPFVKLQHRLMVNGLLQLASDYHKECEKIIKRLQLLTTASQEEQFSNEIAVVFKQIENREIFLGVVDEIGREILKIQQSGRSVNVNLIKSRVKQEIIRSGFAIQRRQYEYFRKYEEVSKEEGNDEKEQKLKLKLKQQQIKNTMKI